MANFLKLPCLEIRQGNRHIYSFAVDGKRIHDFATISRVSRDEGGLSGYQRPEVVSHIRAIRHYLESSGSMLPNAIVMAFDKSVKFQPLDFNSDGAGTSFGHLLIPVGRKSPVALIVDGQQRSAALRDAELSSFAVAVVGFVATDEEEQRSQFILVNSTKPLPKGLINELLPDTSAELPAKYARKKLPAYVMLRLNADSDSPFRGRIATPTSPTGYIKDNSVLKMIENSLYEGALYQYRDPLTGNGDVEQMVLHLKHYWSIVEARWPIEWALPPRKSRLTHGVGIQALGFVMDSLTEGVPCAEISSVEVAQTLAELAEQTAWSSGNWVLADGTALRWNGFQNTPSDVRRLTAHLLGSRP